MTTTNEYNVLEPIISATAIVITDNFEQLKAGLIEQIKLYEIEVTDDNLADAKKMATELNKLSTTINRIKIDKSKEFAAPIEEFKKKAAELVDIVQAGREKILKQVEAFDLKVVKVVTSLLAEERIGLFEAMAVKPEFQTAKIDPLIIKSNLTAGGQLTKAAKDKLAEMVKADKAVQDMVESRKANLSAITERAGIVGGIYDKLIEPFIKEPEAIYTAKLNELIDGIVKQQKATEDRIRAEAERKAREEAERLAKQSPEAQKPISAAMPAATATQPEEPTEPKEPTEPQKTYRVEFMGTVSDGQTSDCIAEWLDALGAGQSLTITRE
jgi:antitoxin (DNA-binding transcriptional repressor) of toxin-antitoxin stability system